MDLFHFDGAITIGNILTILSGLIAGGILFYKLCIRLDHNEFILKTHINDEDDKLAHVQQSIRDIYQFLLKNNRKD